MRRADIDPQVPHAVKIGDCFYEAKITRMEGRLLTALVPGYSDLPTRLIPISYNRVVAPWREYAEAQKRLTVGGEWGGDAVDTGLAPVTYLPPRPKEDR